MTKTTTTERQNPQQLKRVLGIPSLLFFGLAYMVPLTVFSTYGIVTDITQGHLAGAYVLTTLAMLFTALSYASIVRSEPTAGSAYAYSKKAFGPGVGFLTGWSMLIDYAMLPMINYMLLGLYINAQFPQIPAWSVILLAIVVVTGLNLFGISVVKNANSFLVAFQLLFVAVFLFLVFGKMDASVGVADPFWSDGTEFGMLAAGASVLALSFLGFDAVSTMAEEAKDPRRTVPVAVVLTVLCGGLLFMVITWASQRAWPDFSTFTSLDTASLELIGHVGGAALEAFFLVAYLVGAAASALTSQAATARVLFSMGRDGVLPRKVFGVLSPRTQSPRNAILVVAAISLIALFADLDVIISLISFGALVAFSMVNLAVIKHFLIDKGLRSTQAYLLYGLLPVIGFGMCVWLWTSLSPLALGIGCGWAVIGLIYLGFISKGFKDVPKTMAMNLEEVQK